MANKTAEELKKNLSEMQLMTQNHGTEPNCTTKKWRYHCLICDAPLFFTTPVTGPDDHGTSIRYRKTFAWNAAH